MMVEGEFVDSYNRAIRQSWGRPFFYLPPEIVEAELKGAETRIVLHGAEGDRGFFRYREIFWRGQWYTLCRTDLKDNVTTYGGIAFGSPDGVCWVSLEHNYYGARVTDKTIFIIDAFSDG